MTHRALQPLALRRVAVITHFYSPGPAHELVDYLVPRVDEVVFFGQPLPAKASAPSFYRSYRNGKLVTERTGGVFYIPDLVRYMKDFLAVVWFFAREPRFDLIIALDPLNTAAIRVGRIFNWFPASVYYTIDYVPNRFGNALLNRFYHWLDRTDVAASTWTWNLSPRMATARAKRWSSHNLDAKQLTVPMGTHELTTTDVRRTNHGVVFMGHLRVGQGVERLLEATAIAVKKIPDLQLAIVGDGELLEPLKVKAQTLKLDEHVTFTGFVADNQSMRRYLLEANLAVALYEDSPDTYTRYSDPGKPKEYLAAGLPVLISDVPAIAREIDAAGAGLVVDDSAAALATAMVALLKDPKKLAVVRAAALRLAATFRWDRMYDQAFRAMSYHFLKP
jgi:glycosyltransferase involved in cell wall biosynthesis